ncbi:hypothetical protein [Microlunatus sp. GCM10028923]|uniref:hypothetical protein n=1 Tax=Microlunatus sp. GCM10028923 TaxID=3273400 RepID=UPI003624006B
MPRRRLLAGGVAGAALVALPALPGTEAAAEDRGRGRLAVIPPLPPGAPDRRLFAPAEQRLAPYLVTLAALVNEIDDSDTALRGRFQGGWWRTPDEPYNARVQEHVHTLSWFYARRRPWNPYTGSVPLLHRLDCALGYYLSLQHDDGSWPELSAEERSRAATAFALGYLSKTVRELRPLGVLGARLRQVSAALRRAMVWFLDPGNGGVWQDRFVEFVNQPMAGLAGAGLALELDPDPDLRRLWLDRIDFITRYGQSPAGFFHEPRGMDIGYNLNVTPAELVEIRAAVPAPGLVTAAERFADWLGYNLVAEPDGAGFIANTAASARTTTYFLDAVTPDRQQRDLGSRLCAEVPGLRPYFPADEERQQQRAAWRSATEPVPALERGDTNPRIIVNVDLGETYPSRADRQAAIERLPYLRSSRWTELRYGDDDQQQYLFARRPGYYTLGFYGRRATTLVRSGLALLWHPAGGTFVHSGHNANDDCWGTYLTGLGVDANGDLAIRYYEGEIAADTELVGAAAVAGADELVLAWRTGSGRVSVQARLGPDRLTKIIDVTQPGAEQVPLLLRDDDQLTTPEGAVLGADPVDTTASGLRIRRGSTELIIDWTEPRPIRLGAPKRGYFADASRRLRVLSVLHDQQLTVEYDFAPPA